MRLIFRIWIWERLYEKGVWIRY